MRTHSFKIKFFIFIAAPVAVFLATAQSQAHWATAADADYSSESENLDYTIHKDGTYEIKMNRTISILKESARATMGVSRHYYDPEAAEFKFVKGETINDGVEIPVEKKFVEDKPLASFADGFDNRNQVTVAFPDVKVGSKIYEEYENRVFKVPVKNFFSQRYFVGFQEFEKQATIHLKSEVPLFIEKNDPLNKLEITESKSGDKNKYGYEATISLKNPLFSRVMHEKNSLISEKDKTWVAFSNVKNYSDILNPLAEKYEEITASPLPADYQSIIDAARKEKSPEEQINVVTSKLAELVRYVGDWREVKGAYEPHTLAVITQNKFGDCKDFAVSTAAMLRKLGYKANVVAIERGREPNAPTSLPILSTFNHAMVRVVFNDHVHWVDPTNFQSFSQGIFEDVSDRDAVVLEPGHIRTEHTPAMKAKDAAVVSNVVMNFFKDGNVALDGTMDLRGRSAVPITGARLFATEEELSYQLATSFFPDQNLLDYKISGLDLTSRVVRDAHMNIHLTAKNTSLKTTAGSALKLPDAGIINVISNVDLRSRVSDLEMDAPSTMDLTYRLDNVKLVGNRIHGCSLKSPWLNADLKISQEGKRVIVRDIFMNHVSVLHKEDMLTDTFKDFQQKFKDCFENVAVVYVPMGAPPLKTRTLTSSGL